MKQLLRLYYTLKPLKLRQCWYRIVQPQVKRVSALRRVSPDDIAAAMARPKPELLSLRVSSCYQPDSRTFRFLHLEAAFAEHIDWNYARHGLLWLYNLHYFEWLYDDRLSVEARMQTISSYVAAGGARVGLDGYPASLRIIAWIRFLLRHGIKDDGTYAVLYQHCDWLCRFPEYGIDGNHLWENAVALTVAGLFFQNSRFFRKGKALLSACMREQLFADGGHKEGSPMYHSLLLWRLLQCIELMRALPMEQDGWLPVLEEVARKMLGWLSAVTFSDGSWPAVNDCTDGIAPTTASLEAYAQELHITAMPSTLADSQYRMIRMGPFELFIDAADIAPSFQPGHAHADTGTFCLHVHGRPLIVDSGVSTYDGGALRSSQRGTAAHNTLSIVGVDSSDVWKSFRVGRRASVITFKEDEQMLELSHNGYAPGVHKRTFNWSDDTIVVTDCFEDPANRAAQLNLHFHPDIDVNISAPGSYITGAVSVSFQTPALTDILHYNWAAGFNLLSRASVIRTVIDHKTLITIFRII